MQLWDGSGRRGRRHQHLRHGHWFARQQPALLRRGTTELPLAETSQHALLAVAQQSGQLAHRHVGITEQAACLFSSRRRCSVRGVIEMLRRRKKLRPFAVGTLAVLAVGGMTGTLTTVDVPETWGACREALEERLGTGVFHFDDPDIH